MRNALLVLMCTLMLAGCTSTSTSTSSSAQDTEGPKQLVTTYMDALKASDYAKALSTAGLPLPQALADQLNAGVKSGQDKFKWVVTGYTIKDVKVDGGLAEVTVEETSTREGDPSVKAGLAMAGEIGSAIKWGEIKTTETFVLVRLNGKWQFDTPHSGVAFDKLPVNELTEAANKGQMPPSETQKKVAEFINTVGVGQVSMTLSSPAVPLLAGIMVPNFVRARKQGEITACKSNLKNIGTALEMWSTDNSGRFPEKLSQLTPNYLKMIPTCPSAGKDTYSEAFASASGPDAYTVVCAGHNHESAGYSENFPQYTSLLGLIDR